MHILLLILGLAVLLALLTLARRTKHKAPGPGLTEQGWTPKQRGRK